MPDANVVLNRANIIASIIEIIVIVMIAINILTPFCLNSSIMVLKLNASFMLFVFASLQRAMISPIANTSDMIKEMSSVSITFRVGGAVCEYVSM